MHAHAISNSTARADVAGAARSACFNLGHQAANNLSAISSVQRVAPGETLFSEGDETDSVYQVVRGMMRLYKLLPDGRRQITGFLSAGQFLGLAPEDVCVFTAEAITEVAVCRYKRAKFERLIEEVPGFARRLLAATSHELHAAQEQMLLLGRKSATEKLASFLLLMADRLGGEGADEVEVPMTRGDIADYLGLTVETVSRTLTRLKEDRLIALPTYARIEIRDRDQLEELAAGESDESC
jgi:CRP/FNR family transcriptional regulator, anaerobic regulatory protein